MREKEGVNHQRPSLFFFNHNLPPRTEGNMVESQVRFFFLKRSTRRVCLL